MKILVLGFVLFSIVACTKNVGISVMHPGDIPIPKDLDTVLIVDRSKMPKGNGKQIGNILEGLLSGEPIAGDKYGRKGCLENLEFIIATNERLTIANREVVVIENSNGNFDNNIPLKVDFIDSLCKKYGADGIIALEHFDSDRLVSHYRGSRSGETFVTTHWRLYYPGETPIVDEQEFRTYGQGYNTTFIGPPLQYKAIFNAGAQAADWYIKRIVPCLYNEQRVYFTTGSKEMRIAAKHAKVNNWSEARYMWEVVVDGPASPKLLGMAAYNLAVANEMEGNLNMAITWANKSARTGNKKAPAYLSILNTLLNELPLIEEQLKRE